MCLEEIAPGQAAWVSEWGWLHDEHLQDDEELADYANQVGCFRPIELPGIGWT